MSVRVRFAPSPTGPLHMGGVRTALYNYLFAKKHGGQFLLRIEDTDQTRFVPGAEQYIIDSLKWCGLEPDEGVGYGGDCGPYRQSERKPMYRQYADMLINNGSAYLAFDTPEELDAMRELAKTSGMPNWQYNATTRSSMKNTLTLSADEVKERLDKGDEYVVRIKFPRNEEIRFHDEIRGWVVVNTNNVDDKVLFKSDGMPTYHLANIVDDHLMRITHVIRGEEWLPSAPLHVFLYRSFGWEDTMPKFAHLPLILKPDGNGKLSKRDGDRLGFPVFPLEWADPETGNISSGYRESGYLPEAFVNMLLLLGWNPGTPQEIFTIEEMVQSFTIERVGKSGSKFDPDKTKWFNQQYLRALSPQQLAAMVQPMLRQAGINVSDEYCAAASSMMTERASFPQDVLANGMFLFKRPDTYDTALAEKKWSESAKIILRDLMARFAALADLTEETVDAAFKGYMADQGLGFGQVGPVVRLALSGSSMGPGVPQMIALFGLAETQSRFENAIAKFG